MYTRGKNLDRSLGLLVAALLALPGTVLAQQGQHHPDRDRGAQTGQLHGTMMGTPGHGRMTGMMGAGMMGTDMMGTVAGPGPAMLLRQKEALNLSVEQVTQLEALQERLAEARTGHMKAMRPLHQKATEFAKDPDPDLAAYESTLRALAEEHVAMHAEMARVGQEARAVLTPEQRDDLEVGMRFMGEMVRMMGGQMGSGGSMGSMMGRMSCPMMGGPPSP